MPSYKLVFALVILCVLVIVVVFIVLLYAHPHSHRFWGDKPVRFPSLLSRRAGLIQLERGNTNQPLLPEDCKMQLLHHLPNKKPFLNKSTFKRYSHDVMKLMNDGYSYDNKYTQEELTYDLTVMNGIFYILYYKTHPVGLLYVEDTKLHTPLHTSLHTNLCKHLYILPEYRNKGYARSLMESALRDTRLRDNHEPIAFFAVPYNYDINNQSSNVHSRARIPFDHTAIMMRKYIKLSPTLLPDPFSTVTHRVVRKVKQLPPSAFETSHEDIHHGMTLEPALHTSYAHNHWSKVLQHPHYTLLALDSKEWVLISCKIFNALHIVTVLGHSFHDDNMHKLIPHMYMFLKNKYISQNEVLLVVQDPLADAFDDHPQTPSDIRDNWRYFDAYKLYMYNYAVHRAHIKLPHTFHYDMFSS